MGISIFLIAAVLLISLVLTMVGLGGGLIFTPLFILMGFVPAQAASASLFLNFIAVASAAYTYSKKKMVDFSLSVPLILSSCLAAPAGAYFNTQITPRPYMIFLAVILILAGCRMLIPSAKHTESQDPGKRKKWIGGIIIGTVIGFTGGLLGIGGGVFVVPLLIYGLKVPTKIAAASSTFIVCFSSLTGFLGYASMGNIDWKFILPAAIASFTGGQIGSRIMSGGIKPSVIRNIFSVILFGLAVKIILQCV